MGFLEWMGFSKPRDAPEKNLPEVTDSVRDSGQIFSFMGRIDPVECVSVSH